MASSMRLISAFLVSGGMVIVRGLSALIPLVMREKLSDPNCIGSAWRIWKVENVVGKKGEESVCKHGGRVSKLVTVTSLLTFLN